MTLEDDSTEYFVKFIDLSHRQCRWVPHWWLSAISPRKVKSYERRQQEVPPRVSEVVLLAFMRPDRVIAEYKCDDLQVYCVKWVGLNYDEVSWERAPSAEDTDLVRAVAEYHRKFELRTAAPLAGSGYQRRPARVFTEYTEQPSHVVGGQLEGYQLQGMNWLVYNWTKKISSMLADEMGVGKTIQTLAFLSCLLNEFKVRPFLVVAPLSTCTNWMREIAKWTPDIYAVNFSGNEVARRVCNEMELDMSRFRRPCGAHIIVTSYEMAMMKSPLMDIKWEVVVVDEGHRLKNAQSKLMREMQRYTMKHRVLLTGTPLQNDLEELFTLIRFLAPDLPGGSAEALSNKFADLAEEGKVRELHELLRPYVLRRTKADVLKQLPPKAELIVPVPMSAFQRKVYQAIVDRDYVQLRATQRSGTTPARKVSMLNLLMQLRKCALHPYLLPDTEPEYAYLYFCGFYF